MNKEEKKEYNRKWYEENKEKISEQKRKYCEENKEKISEQKRKYYEENKEKIKEYNRKYCEENKEKKSEQKRKYYEENKEKILKYRKELRLKILDHYCNGNIKCQNCDIEDIRVLTLDHIYNNGNIHRKKNSNCSGNGLYHWIIKNNFPPIFQVLCMNCNWLKYHKTRTGVSA